MNDTSPVDAVLRTFDDLGCRADPSTCVPLDPEAKRPVCLPAGVCSDVR